MAKFVWQDGTLVSKAKVEVGGTIYEVDPEEYSGSTPLSASNLNAMVNNIYDDLDANVYSTTETVIGTWLGKPLYRKVYDIGNLPNNTYKDISTGLINVIVQNIYGRAYNPNTTNVLALPYAATIIESNVSVAFNNKNIRITTAVDRSDWTGYIVLEYTKTND